MAKPMLVTLPFVLLLLDWWPLGRTAAARKAPGRVDRSRLGLLVLEKIPFLLLAAASSWITLVAQSRGGMVKPLAAYGAAARLGNAALAYVTYLGKTLWPANLAMPYAHSGLPAAWRVTGAVLLLAGATLLALWLRRSRPSLLAGWLWYLGMLVPVIGIVQVGDQALADRYTYLPLTGIFVAAVWWAGTKASGGRRPILAVAATAILLLSLGVTSWRQAGYWRDNATLVARGVLVAPDNWLVLNNQGVMLAREGRREEAERAYRRAIQSHPKFAYAWFNLGNLLMDEGRHAEAVNAYRQAIGFNPSFDDAFNNMGMALEKVGNAGMALEHYLEAVRLNPSLAPAQNNLGLLLARSGRWEEAVEHYRAAIRARPDMAASHANLAAALLRLGRAEEADREYAEARRLRTAAGRRPSPPP